MSQFVRSRGRKAARRAKFEQLFTARWQQAQQQLPVLQWVYLTWDFGPYEHFQKKRGFGVTLSDGDPYLAHIRFAPKLLDQVRDRQDGIICHEIGHVVDLALPGQLPSWLPQTPELRADGIAEMLFGTRLLYDRDLVQTTSGRGNPRPRHLGL